MITVSDYTDDKKLFRGGAEPVPATKYHQLQL